MRLQTGNYATSELCHGFGVNRRAAAMIVVATVCTGDVKDSAQGSAGEVKNS